MTEEQGEAPMTGKPYALRAVQMDLARQMETVEYVKHFIDFAKRFGYNAVALYLEARIRTPSFPYPTDDECYTPAQIHDIVAFAGERDMDVIPVVSTLGHVELFLQYPELKHLSELREGRGSAFDPQPRCFCPSLPETLAFLESYLTEVAALFPSKYFHIGCDEVWDFCYCSECRARIENGETPGDVFAAHIRFSHDVLAKKLGKRVMMWDDMNEAYPDVLDQIPTDTIQVVWQYESPIEKCRSHFGQVRLDDRMAQYRAKGFDYLIAPAPWTPSNSDTLTAYARRFEPLGGLMTTWEQSTHFMLEHYPNLAFCARRWRQPDLEAGKELWHAAAGELFGLDDPAFLDALWAVRNLPRSGLHNDLNRYLAGPPSHYSVVADGLLAMAEHTLQPYGDRLTDPVARAVLGDIMLGVRLRRLQAAIRSLLQSFYRHWRGECTDTIAELVARGRALLNELAAAREVRETQWETWRPGITPVRAAAHVQTLYDQLETFLAKAERGEAKTGLLSVAYFIPDYYSAQSGRWSVLYEGESEWETLYEGQPKPDPCDYGQYPLYRIERPFDGANTPARLRFESWGFGGVGVCCVEAHTPHGAYVPARVENIRGLVANPERLAENDTFHCYVGQEDTHKAFMNRALSEEIHGFEVVLEKADDVNLRGLTRRDPTGFVAR